MSALRNTSLLLLASGACLAGPTGAFGAPYVEAPGPEVEQADDALGTYGARCPTARAQPRAADRADDDAYDEADDEDSYPEAEDDPLVPGDVEVVADPAGDDPQDGELPTDDVGADAPGSTEAAPDGDEGGDGDCATTTTSMVSSLQAVLQRGTLDPLTVRVRGRGTVKVAVRLAGSRRPKALKRPGTVALATATRPVTHAGSVRIVARLTPAGRRVLRRARTQVRLSARSTLVTPRARRAAGARTIVLRRAQG